MEVKAGEPGSGVRPIKNLRGGGEWCARWGVKEYTRMGTNSEKKENAVPN